MLIGQRAREDADQEHVTGRARPWAGAARRCLATVTIRKLKSILHFVDKQPAPPLLPILRSQQQGEILALLLGDPDLELLRPEIAVPHGTPHPSVYREIQGAEQAGLFLTRKVVNTRLVRAIAASPYYG